MKRSLAAVVLALSLGPASSARAEQPPPAPPPVETDSPFDDDSADAPAPEPAPAPGAPVSTEPPPPAAPPPARSALHPSPGPLADPTPTAYPPLDAVGAREHDAFYFRVLFGPATMQARTGHRSLSGGGFDLGFAAGHALRKDLILQLDSIFSSVPDPSYEVDGEAMDERSISAVAIGLGPGITYYAPHNLYATGAVYASWLNRTETREVPPDPADPFGQPGTEEVHDRSDTGIGASLTLGKEWWLTESWGLGIAARAYFASMPDAESADTTWGVHSLALLLSATLN